MNNDTKKNSESKHQLFYDIQEMGDILDDLKDWVNTYPNHKVSNYHIKSQDDFYQKVINLVSNDPQNLLN